MRKRFKEQDGEFLLTASKRQGMVKLLKDDVHSVLRISSAHNKWGPPDINIAQMLHL
jgi:hypothetical protein